MRILRSNPYGRVCLVMLCLGLFPVQRSWADQSVTSLVPDNAILFVATGDLASLSDNWDQTGLGKLWASEEMASFRQSWQLERQVSPDCSIPRLGLDWNQLKSIAGGDVCFSFLPIGDHDAGFLLLVDTDGKSQEVDQLLEQLKNTFAGCKKVSHATTATGQFTVEEFRQQTSNGAPPGRRIYFRSEKLFGVTDRAELITAVLASQDRSTLVGSESYQAIQHQCLSASEAETGVASWYFDPWSYERITRSQVKNGEISTLTRMQQQGFSIIRAIGGVISLNTEAHDVAHHWLIYTVGKREKTAQMLEFSPVDSLTLPDWIPEGVDSVRVVGWNLTAALKGYGFWADSIWAEGLEGTFEESLNDIRDQPYGPQVDVRALIAQQEGPLLEISRTVGEDGNRRTQIAYAVKFRDEEKAISDIKKFFTGDEGVTLKTIEGHPVWVFKNAPGIPGPDLTGSALSFVHGHLLATNDVELLTHFFAPIDSSLTDGEAYQHFQPALVAHYPEKCIGWRVVLSPSGIGPAYEDWQRRGNQLLASLLAREETNSVAFSQLPPLEFAQHFLPAELEFAQETPAGWLISTFHVPHPKKEQPGSVTAAIP